MCGAHLTAFPVLSGPIYIYIYICVCVCVCQPTFDWFLKVLSSDNMMV